MSDLEAEIVCVTTTAPDAGWLHDHCNMLIERRLAATANIIPAISSIYWWQGRVRHQSEAYAILQTQAKCFERIAELTDQYHPYSVVHITSQRCSEVAGKYAQWIVDCTSASSSVD